MKEFSFLSGLLEVLNLGNFILSLDLDLVGLILASLIDSLVWLFKLESALAFWKSWISFFCFSSGLKKAISFSGITLPLEIQTFLSLPLSPIILSFFLESSTFFQRLAIRLSTFLPGLLDFEVAADSDTVSGMSGIGDLGVLTMSTLVGVLLPSLEFKLWLELDCFKLELEGLGMLLLELVVLEPEPCLDRDLSLRAEVLV